MRKEDLLRAQDLKKVICQIVVSCPQSVPESSQLSLTVSSRMWNSSANIRPLYFCIVRVFYDICWDLKRLSIVEFHYFVRKKLEAKTFAIVCTVKKKHTLSFVSI